MHIYKKLVFLLILFLSINQVVLAQINKDDWSQIKVEALSDAQIKNIQNYLEQNNVSGSTAEQMALSKGLPMAEWIKLKGRLSQSTGKPGTPNNTSVSASEPVERSVTRLPKRRLIRMFLALHSSTPNRYRLSLTYV
jgi:hypothetical protein